MTRIYVDESYELSSKYEKRFVVFDKDTGEVLDDAQGYGYKSKSKAYSAWFYKENNGHNNCSINERDYYIKKWLEEHYDFTKKIDMLFCEIKEGKCGKGVWFNYKTIARLLKENNIKTDFTPGELLHVYKKIKKEENNG